MPLIGATTYDLALGFAGSGTLGAGVGSPWARRRSTNRDICSSENFAASSWGSIGFVFGFLAMVGVFAVE